MTVVTAPFLCTTVTFVPTVRSAAVMPAGRILVSLDRAQLRRWHDPVFTSGLPMVGMLMCTSGHMRTVQ